MQGHFVKISGENPEFFFAACFIFFFHFSLTEYELLAYIINIISDN